MKYLGPDRRRGDRRAIARRSLEVRPTLAYVDLSALRHNLRVVQAAAGDRTRVLAVVKADAYGHDAVAASRALVDGGAWGLAVSLVEEGVELRQAGILAPILVLGGVFPGAEDVVVHRALTPVVWAPEHLARLGAAVRRAGAPSHPVHLQVDTGMARLGALPEQLPGVLDAFERESDSLELEGFMTHFARADEPGDPVTGQQLERFRDALQSLSARGLQPSLRHVCNSAGLVRVPEAHYDMVRPGIALYGAASSMEVELPGLRAGMALETRLFGIREVPAGTPVSYGHRERVERASRLGILPVGYEDGYPRNMSGQAQVLIRGHRCRVIGNITMDTSMVDVTDLPDAREGERVTLMGVQGRERITIYDLARWASVLPYEVICGISERVPRRLERPE